MSDETKHTYCPVTRFCVKCGTGEADQFQQETSCYAGNVTSIIPRIKGRALSKLCPPSMIAPVGG